MLQPYRVHRLYASHECKALETAALVAERLQIPVEMYPGVQEHVRMGAPFMSQEKFIVTMKRFFREPQALVFGRETAEKALTRFSDAVDSLLQSDPQESIAIVTHGTVISLFAAAHNSHDPFRFWMQLGQPAVIVFAVPSLSLARTAFTV